MFIHDFKNRTKGYQSQELTVPCLHGTLHRMSKASESTEDLRRGFSLRLNDALDRVGVPPKNEGRQTTLARLLKDVTGRAISQKGVRKWLEGEAMPTEENRQALVRICGVSYQWLFGSVISKTPYKSFECELDSQLETSAGVRGVREPVASYNKALNTMKLSLDVLPENVSPQVVDLIQKILSKSRDGKLSEGAISLLISTVIQLSSDKT